MNMGFGDKLKAKIADRAAAGTKKALERTIKKTQASIDDRTAEMNITFKRLLENSNETNLAVLSVYKAIEALAKAQKVELPKPLTVMELEGEDVI